MRRFRNKQIECLYYSVAVRESADTPHVRCMRCGRLVSRSHGRFLHDDSCKTCLWCECEERLGCEEQIAASQREQDMERLIQLLVALKNTPYHGPGGWEGGIQAAIDVLACRTQGSLQIKRISPSREPEHTEEWDDEESLFEEELCLKLRNGCKIIISPPVGLDYIHYTVGVEPKQRKDPPFAEMGCL